MRRIILLVAFMSLCFVGKAQRLSFDQLNGMLSSTLDEAEERLFLVGYSFVSKQYISDSAEVIYHFSNKKNTIGTAKKVSKGVYTKDLDKSFVKYTTYDRAEFQNFRKLMVEYQFTRSGKDSISENSNYSKDNLLVNFEVTADQYENKTFLITLTNNKAIISDKLPKKISLKSIFKQ
ncbi:hypothetical protein WG906_01670 [Pedobacter sp. P351]|uniref:hypothetical protein n=1 Tax=Pedobacter superstes TaxID=3133441 RepID=UPI0030A6F0A0